MPHHPVGGCRPTVIPRASVFPARGARRQAHPVAGLPAIVAGQSHLRPMDLPDGSPTHPACGAGHATVAGACVTAPKALLEMAQADGVTERHWPLAAGQGPGGSGAYGFGRVCAGNEATPKKAAGSTGPTVQGALDKLAADIAVALCVCAPHPRDRVDRQRCSHDRPPKRWSSAANSAGRRSLACASPRWRESAK